MGATVAHLPRDPDLSVRLWACWALTLRPEPSTLPSQPGDGGEVGGSIPMEDGVEEGGGGGGGAGGREGTTGGFGAGGPGAWVPRGEGRCRNACYVRPGSYLSCPTCPTSLLTCLPRNLLFLLARQRPGILHRKTGAPLERTRNIKDNQDQDPVLAFR